MALILMARRRLPTSMDVLRRGEWGAFRMDAFLGLDVHGATLGLIGYGQIGRALARRAAGFGMRVQHYHPRRRENDELSRWVPFDELLRTSDVVSLHTPLTEETKGMIGAVELALMKPTATLVNTGRGGIVDEEALLASLRCGELHSAGLDVMTGEPRTDPSDPLFDEPRLVLLPHVASANRGDPRGHGGTRRPQHRDRSGGPPRTRPAPRHPEPARPACPACGAEPGSHQRSAGLDDRFQGCVLIELDLSSTDSGIQRRQNKGTVHGTVLPANH